MFRFHSELKDSDGEVSLYDVNVGGKRVNDSDLHTEYERTVEVSNAPDTFPCGHTLCHGCIRKHLLPYKRLSWECPVCYNEFGSVYAPETLIKLPDDDEPNSEHIKLMFNYDQIVTKFNGINYSLRRLKDEKVESKSVCMRYTSCPCSMCDENHGILNVAQEYNHLRVQHLRPKVPDPYFYRLSTGHIVTSFYSVVNSSCVCVPCTYKEIHENPERFPAITNNNVKGSPENALAEVGRVVTSCNAPVQALQGKNVIEIDHSISVKERADQYDFNSTTEMIKRLVRREEKNLVRIAQKQVRDTGGVYHIKESNSVDYNMGETVV